MEFKTKKKKEEKNLHERGRTLTKYKTKRKNERKNKPKMNERNERKKVSEVNERQRKKYPEMKPQRTDERGFRKE